jgi:hypothetical protein
MRRNESGVTLKAVLVRRAHAVTSSQRRRVLRELAIEMPGKIDVFAEIVVRVCPASAI